VLLLLEHSLPSALALRFRLHSEALEDLVHQLQHLLEGFSVALLRLLLSVLSV
jgi:hypothetical protein